MSLYAGSSGFSYPSWKLDGKQVGQRDVTLLLAPTKSL